MEWWFDPDRRFDYQRRIEETGATDFTVSITAEDGVLVRISSWKDNRHWHNRHRTETHLSPDGLATHSGERFIAPFTEHTELQSPAGRHLNFVCTGQFEFIPTDDDSTEVVSTHAHALTGGNWLHRQQIWKSDLEAQPRLYREQCERCEAHLRSTRERVCPYARSVALRSAGSQPGGQLRRPPDGGGPMQPS